MNLEDLIYKALEEDLGEGDHTSLALVPNTEKGKTVMIAKESGVVAGIDVAALVFKTVDSNLQINSFVSDGQEIEKGDILMEISGSALSMLSAERLSLNFIQRMSGIATYTRFLLNMVDDLPVKLLDTRKTTPCNRLVEKMAVKAGGGYNHRFGLYDMVMIKDNHIDFAGGIKQSIDKIHAYLKNNDLDLKIEIEARSFEELNEIISVGGIHRIMLDNFSPADLKKAVKIINKKYETEASGGINEQTLRMYAETGVDYISIGALTHQIKSLDISLKAVI